MVDLSAAGQAAALSAATREREVIESLLHEAVATGELMPDTDVDALAWHYLGVLQAILNLPQAGADVAVLKRMLDVAMSAWPTTPAGCRASA